MLRPFAQLAAQGMVRHTLAIPLQGYLHAEKSAIEIRTQCCATFEGDVKQRFGNAFTSTRYACMTNWPGWLYVCIMQYECVSNLARCGHRERYRIKRRNERVRATRCPQVFRPNAVRNNNRFRATSTDGGGRSATTIDKHISFGLLIRPSGPCSRPRGQSFRRTRCITSPTHRSWV
jgi:hypothetical protein